MQDQIVLMEERKEVTTFLLDDGDVISKEVITIKGKDIGYEYSSKLYPEDTVAISPKSEIGKEMVKKYTGSEVPIGIVVSQPTVMDNGQRKASVLMLGQLYRLRLASGVNDIAPADRIRLSSDGAVKDSSGEFLALHPVENSEEYNYVNCFKLACAGGSGSAGEKGDTGPKGDTGAKGDTGDTGPKGDTGDTGTSVSIKGSYGTLTELETAHPTGNVGDAYLVSSDLYVWNGNAWENVGQIKGDKGDTGETGPQGIKGETGDTGPAEPKGDTGEAFTYEDFTAEQLAGLKGDKGDTGAKGDTGDTGPQGVKGDTGDVGATGEKGDTGDTGATGAKGDTGDDGSGVEVYKDTAHKEIIFQGESTTAVVYFSEITGPKGDTGATGAKGDTGLVNLADSLNTTDTTNAIKNAPVAVAIENLQTAIGTITSAQQSNLNLLGS